MLADTPDTTGASAVTAHLLAEVQAAMPTDTPGEVGREQVLRLVSQAVNSGSWGLLGVALVLGSVYGVLRHIVPGVPWLASDMGGVLLALRHAAPARDAGGAH